MARFMYARLMLTLVFGLAMAQRGRDRHTDGTLSEFDLYPRSRGRTVETVLSEE